MLAAFAVFFVVVFPLAPTPTAVHHGKAIDFSLMLLVATLCAAAQILVLATLLRTADAMVPQSVSVIDLTCTRLC